MSLPAQGTPLGRMRLFIVLAGLYLAQSIPMYVVAAAVPPILREQGVSRTTIGFMSFLMLPLVLKFIWAPAVDRFRPFARAHRASWVLITQIVIALCFVALALVRPTDVASFFAIAFVLSVALSTQDIATDGYATKHLAEADRPAGNAIQGGSIAAGVVIGGTGSLLIYHHWGWQTVMLTMAAVSLAILPITLAMRENDGPAAQSPPRASIMAFLRRPEARTVLLVAFFYRASEGLVKAMEGPYLVDRGVPLDAIGYLSGLSAATAGLAGSAIAAYLLVKLGARHVLNLLGGLRTLCFLIFTLHALGTLAGFVPLFGAAAFQTLIRYMEIVALYSLFMGSSSKEQPGTDFTILACAQLVIYLIGSAAAGLLADRLGYPALFGLATALSLAAVLFTSHVLGRQGDAKRPAPA
ncbi:MAG: MFS transporter [Parvibaculaceae bacterium]